MRARRHLAICAAWLWLLAAVVLPSLHLGAHDLRHTHAVDGAIVTHADDGAEAELERLHRLAHRQAGTKCLHGKPAPRGPGYHAPVGGHAAAGIAHLAAALSAPPPPLAHPITQPVAETWQHATPNARLAIAHAARPSARGPPIARAPASLTFAH